MTLDTTQILILALIESGLALQLLLWYAISTIARGQRAAPFPPIPTRPAPAPPVVPPIVVPPVVAPPDKPPVTPDKPPVVLPPVVPPVVVQPPVVPPVTPLGSDFARCIAVTLKWEGGNDDDPDDSGGRTSRGITAGDWAAWRQTHPGLDPDVWKAPQDQIVAIYKQRYWDPLFCDSLPNGVDMVVFDHGVLAGIGTSSKLLQRIVGTDVDGEIGPLTIGAAAAIDPVSLVGKFCDGRLEYYQSLNRPKYIKGWTNRVVDVRKEALALAAEAPRPKAMTAPPAPLAPIIDAKPDGAPPWLQTMQQITGTHEVAGPGDNPVILSWATAIAKKFPDMASYCARYNHDSIAWCGLAIAYCMAMAGVRPQFGPTDTDKFLWADSWRQFGTAVDTPQPGDVLVFQWSNGGHHVTLYDHETAGDQYACRGGNQSDMINVTMFPMSACTAIRRPQK